MTTNLQIITKGKASGDRFLAGPLLMLTRGLGSALLAVPRRLSCVATPLYIGVRCIVGMSSRAMRAFGEAVTNASADVFQSRYRLQVRWVLATAMGARDSTTTSLVRIVASVINNLPLRYRAFGQLISKAMGIPSLEEGVAGFSYPRQPRPTFVWPTFVDLRPIETLFGHSRKSISHVFIVT